MTVTQTHDEFEHSLDQAQDHAKAWRFDQDGAMIVGEVVGFGEYDAGWSPYPIVTLRLADGNERAVHCQREVLSRELARARPQIGERLGIKWLGQPDGKKYHRYVVRVDRPEGTTFDWGRYVEGAAVEEAAPVRTAPTSVPADGDPGPQPPAFGGDDDIPF
jgi:hypothetical protein